MKRFNFDVCIAGTGVICLIVLGTSTVLAQGGEPNTCGSDHCGTPPDITAPPADCYLTYEDGPVRGKWCCQTVALYHDATARRNVWLNYSDRFVYKNCGNAKSYYACTWTQNFETPSNDPCT